MWFDFDKIEKIMFNILSNAIKYTPENGKINIKISSKKSRKVRHLYIKKRIIKFSSWIKIEVTDSGVGIPKRNLRKIFDRFYQAEDQKKTAVGGTGIGLALAKEMVEIHHGNIKVESDEETGTSFIFRIPLIEEHTLEGIIDRKSTEKSHYKMFKYRENGTVVHDQKQDLDKTIEKDRNKILIVEDNLDMREYIKDELENDYLVFAANDGRQGFKEAVKENPDIIISDVMMPHMDGIEFCSKIKTDERTSHIAVILLTARSSQEHKIEGLETGADDYLTKPFVFDELRLRINNIIESRRKFSEQFGRSLKVEPSDIQITSMDQKFIKQAVEIIEENITDPDFNVEKFSRLIGLSRVGLYNKLKALTNNSVQEFIYTVKLKRAAQLLIKSGMSVTEICYEVGVKDPSHFSKLFKKQFGVTPKVYKNEFVNQVN
jgi:DNA-binding response OmpR family regulator